MIDPKYVVAAVRAQAENLQMQYKMLDFLEGNLEPYLVRALKRILSPRVLPYALERLVPINIVPRYVDKLSNIYQTGVLREVQDGTESDTELLGWYEKKLDVNCYLHQGNRLYNACRSTLIHPYIGDEGPDLRIIPNDRFVVVSDNPIEPTEPTMVILLAGRDANQRDIYWAYTEDEFAVVISDETIDYQAMERMGIPDGINPYEVLPFIYVNASHLRLVPVPDVDTIRMAEYIPCALTDLNLAAMFAAFSITYIKNGEVSDPTYAPNALWFLKADDPEKEVEIGTLKPEVSYQEVLNLIQSEMSLWLGSKGIKTGSVGSLNASESASGISKVIDEADSFEVRQTQAVMFSKAEHEMWELILEKMHPIWVAQGLVENRTLFSPSASVNTRFSVVPVGTQRSQLIQDQREEYAAGFTTRSRAIAMLNPQMTMTQVEELEQDITGVSPIDAENIDAPVDGSNPVDQSTNIQDAVLNGAQVQSAVEIMTAAAIGQIPRASAQALFMMAFQLDETTANKLLSDIGQGFVPSAVQGNVTTKKEVAGNGVAELQS
jgi:hypothetical protein